MNECLTTPQQNRSAIGCRARIGHIYMTHSYILKKDPPPQCEHCQCILTVCHIWVECNHLAQTRNDIFNSTLNLKTKKLILVFIQNFKTIKL